MTHAHALSIAAPAYTCSFSQIREQYADRVPVIVERNPTSRNLPDIDKKKFLAPADITVAKFISEIRKHIR